MADDFLEDVRSEADAFWGDLGGKFDEQDESIKKREGGTTANAIVNEMVKAYGWSRSAEGDWSWDLETIGKSFKEDPIWSTIDWLALVVPVAKWGTSVRAVQKGVGAAGKALQAEEFAGATTKGMSLIQKGFAAKFGAETMRAARLYKEGPSRFNFQTASGRNIGFSNPITTRVGDEYAALVDKFGAEVYERKAIGLAAKRELTIEQGMRSREASDIIRGWDRSGLSRAQMARGVRFLEEGRGPSDELLRASFAGNEKGLKAYEATWNFRNSVHDAAYETGLISRKTYARNLERYSPKLYKEWQTVVEATDKLAGVTPGRITVGAGVITGAAARFAARGPEPKSLTRILDPKAAVAEIGNAGQIIAKQRFAQGIARSTVSSSADEVSDIVLSALRDGNVKLAMMHGVTKAQLRDLEPWIKSMEGVGREVAAEEIAAKLGWRRLDEMFGNAKVPGYIERLPDELKGRLIDPAAAGDVVGVLKYMDTPGLFSNFYNKTLSSFRASKTAYNPATHMRNTFGAAVFHHLAVGGVPKIVPLKGLRAYKGLNEDYRQGRRAGIIGSSFDAEIREALPEYAQKGWGTATAVDWMGASAIAKWTQAGAGKAERFYRGIDEVYKLDAFVEIRNKALKRGLGSEDAIAHAVLEVNKFMPSFVQHSDVGNVVRQAIPFASFTTEAFRVWKNALVEKPHLAYAWNHITETMGQTFGAMAGFSPEQLEEAQKALPSYTQGKKMVMLPLNVDGQPRFVDMSYLIPMANIVEAEEIGHSFFSNLPIDPTANPLLSVGVAAGAGIDPFSGRKTDPTFTERQLGVAVTGQGARRVVGLAEHMARTMLPPLVPPGYAGVNLLELARGQRHPKTGEKLEDGVFRTIMANLAGIRTYAPDVESQVLNLKREARDVQVRMTQAWKRWEGARANGKVAVMEKEKARIIGLRAEGGHEDAEKYFAKSIKRRQVFASLSTKQLKSALERAESLGALSPRDERMRGELLARLQARSNR